jgi:predicted Rossmann fold flavoprotein
MGISVTDVSIKIMGTSFEQAGPLLITHWGLSGPAVLKLSAWAARDLYAGGYDFKVKINWVPSFNENSLRAELQRIRFDSARQKIHSRNPFGLPARLWDYLLAACKISEDMRWADLPAKTQNLLVLAICGTELSVKGKTTFKEEFVTAGGIALDEVEVNSMESKLWPGLFFAGEILDIDGVTGGFNFQNAWTTAHIAANGICRRIIKATVE